MTTRESRLSEAAPESSTKTTSPSVPRSRDTGARTRRHDYGLLVVSERSDGVLMSQVFTNLPAAERKVARTRERNLFASVSLVRIVPAVGATDADMALAIGEAG